MNDNQEPKKINVDNFLPCPFCGGHKFLFLSMEGEEKLIINDRLPRFIRVDREAETAEIMCSCCDVKMKCVAINEHFEHIEDDLYRKVPKRYAEEILLEKWNRRDGIGE